MPRTYSFSSSPAYMQRRYHTEESEASHNCRKNISTLTYGVVDQQQPGTRNYGTSSNYLASLHPGDTVHVSIAPKQELSSFRAPRADQAGATPIVMIAAGTGIAPFIGFVQERAAYKMNNRTLAPTLLFFGRRGRDLDDLYRQELDAFEYDGVVEVRRAYSRDGSEHVGDRVRACADEVVRLWNRGAVVYVCGARKISDSVLGILKPLLIEADRRNGRLASEVGEEKAWAEVVTSGRYLVEAFA